MEALKAGLAAGARWPNLVIRARARQEYRPDITGPLCLFTNLAGDARTTLSGRRLTIDPACYAVSSAGETFTLEYERPVELLNLYFDEDWVADAAAALALGPGGMDTAPAPAPVVLSHVGLRDERLDRALARVLADLDGGTQQPLALEEALMEVLETVLRIGKMQATWAERIGAAHAATRLEIARRLHRAVDCMVAVPAERWSLDALAQAACLSKFHFLRSFRQFTGFTPSRYLNRIRVRRAQRLLLQRNTPPLRVIAESVGFSEPSALSRAFRREVGMRPGAFQASLGKPVSF